jgi:hypothetical protein
MSDYPALKNSAYTVTFPIFDAAGSLLTGASITSSKVRKDSGSTSPTTNSVTEISDGLYDLALTATEMNADHVQVVIVSNGQPVVVLIRTVARQLKDLAFPSVSGDNIQKEVGDNLVVEGTTTLRKSLRLQNAAAAGKTSGAGTPEFTVRDLADTKDRVVADTDEDGNRTDVALDLS